MDWLPDFSGMMMDGVFGPAVAGKQDTGPLTDGNIAWNTRDTSNGLKSIGKWGLIGAGTGLGMAGLRHVLKYLYDDRYGADKRDNALSDDYTDEQKELLSSITKASAVEGPPPLSALEHLVMNLKGDAEAYKTAPKGPMRPNADHPTGGGWWQVAAPPLAGLVGLLGTNMLTNNFLGDKRKEMSNSNVMDAQVEFEKEKAKSANTTMWDALAGAGVLGALLPIGVGGIAGYYLGKDPQRSSIRDQYKRQIDKAEYDRTTKRLRKSLLSSDNQADDEDASAEAYENLPKQAAFLEGVLNATFFTR